MRVTPMIVDGNARVSDSNEKKMPFVQHAFVIRKDLSDRLSKVFDDFGHDPNEAIEAMLSCVDESKHHYEDLVLHYDVKV